MKSTIWYPFANEHSSRLGQNQIFICKICQNNLPKSTHSQSSVSFPSILTWGLLLHFKYLYWKKPDYILKRKDGGSLCSHQGWSVGIIFLILILELAYSFLLTVLHNKKLEETFSPYTPPTSYTSLLNPPAQTLLRGPSYSSTKVMLHLWGRETQAHSTSGPHLYPPPKWQC